MGQRVMLKNKPDLVDIESEAGRLEALLRGVLELFDASLDNVDWANNWPNACESLREFVYAAHSRSRDLTALCGRAYDNAE